MTLHFREYLGKALTLKNKKLATKLMEEEQDLKEALHQRQLGIAAAATAALAQLGHKKICKVILEDFLYSNRLGLGAPSRPGKKKLYILYLGICHDPLESLKGSSHGG